MKPLTPLATAILCLGITSCGKRKDDDNEDKLCLSRYQKIMDCLEKYNRTHNPQYTSRVCGDKYPEEGCYDEN